MGQKMSFNFIWKEKFVGIIYLLIYFWKLNKNNFSKLWLKFKPMHQFFTGIGLELLLTWWWFEIPMIPCPLKVSTNTHSCFLVKNLWLQNLAVVETDAYIGQTFTDSLNDKRIFFSGKMLICLMAVWPNVVSPMMVRLMLVWLVRLG